jgi:hypothetical protein
MDIDNRTITIKHLFARRDAAQAEIERRGWLYVRGLGYRPFDQREMVVTLVERGTVTLVHIVATFEENHRGQSLDIEVPLPLFTQVVGGEDQR